MSCNKVQINSHSRKDLQWILAQQVAVSLVPLPEWMPDKSLELPAPSHKLWAVAAMPTLGTASNTAEPSSLLPSSPKTLLRALFPANSTSASPDNSSLTITKVLEWDAKRVVLQWALQDRSVHKIMLIVPAHHLHAAIARKLNHMLGQSKVYSEKVGNVSKPFLASLLKPWVLANVCPSDPPALQQQKLSRFLVGIVDEHWQFFYIAKAFNKLHSPLEANAQGEQVSICFNLKLLCLTNWCKYVCFSLHLDTSFDHPGLLSLKSLRRALESKFRSLDRQAMPKRTAFAARQPAASL